MRRSLSVQRGKSISKEIHIDRLTRSNRDGFLSTVQGKLISTLTIIALVLGIAAEGISIYTGWNEAIIKTNQARKAEIETRIGNMVMTSRNLSEKAMRRSHRQSQIP